VAGPVRPADAELRAAVARRESAGTSRREAIAAVAQEYGLPRREVYNLIVSG
jgi:16S rRNA (cytidine1402-2'-O)-methyltransferase